MSAESAPTTLDLRGEEGKYHLHLAARYGYEQIVQQIADAGSPLDLQDEYGHTALHWACGRGHEAVAKILLSKGASLTVRDGFGWTPLHVACDCGRVAIAQVLLDNKAPVNAPDNEGRTPLHYAAAKDRVEIVRLLLVSGADTTIRTADGKTALESCAATAECYSLLQTSQSVIASGGGSLGRPPRSQPSPKVTTASATPTATIARAMPPPPMLLPPAASVHRDDPPSPLNVSTMSVTTVSATSTGASAPKPAPAPPAQSVSNSNSHAFSNGDRYNDVKASTTADDDDEEAVTSSPASPDTSANIVDGDLSMMSPPSPAPVTPPPLHRHEDDVALLERLRAQVSPSPHEAPMSGGYSNALKQLQPLDAATDAEPPARTRPRVASNSDSLQLNLQLLQLRSELQQERKLRKQLQEQFRSSGSSGSFVVPGTPTQSSFGAVPLSAAYDSSVVVQNSDLRKENAVLRNKLASLQIVVRQLQEQLAGSAHSAPSQSERSVASHPTGYAHVASSGYGVANTAAATNRRHDSIVPQHPLAASPPSMPPPELKLRRPTLSNIQPQNRFQPPPKEPTLQQRRAVSAPRRSASPARSAYSALEVEFAQPARAATMRARPETARSRSNQRLAPSADERAPRSRTPTDLRVASYVPQPHYQQLHSYSSVHGSSAPVQQQQPQQYQQQQQQQQQHHQHGSMRFGYQPYTRQPVPSDAKYVAVDLAGDPRSPSPALPSSTVPNVTPSAATATGRICSGCMSNRADVSLLPCQHRVLCSMCASTYSRCPSCNASIDTISDI